MKLYQDICQFVQEGFPNLSVHSSSSTTEREAPYILIECENLGERIHGNETWEHEVRLTLYANAHDWSTAQFEGQVNQLAAFAQYQLRVALLSSPHEDYLIYSLRLANIAPPDVSEDDISQSITLTLLTQT